MEEKERKDEKREKLSYEQLADVCHQLSEQSQTLYRKLQEANLSNMFKRLDYLFAVVENRAAFPEDFVKKCINEIVTSMTIPEAEEKEGDDKEKE